MTKKQKVSNTYILKLLKIKGQLIFNATAWALAIYICNRDGAPLPTYISLTGVFIIGFIFSADYYLTGKEEFTPKLQAKL